MVLPDVTSTDLHDILHMRPSWAAPAETCGRLDVSDSAGGREHLVMTEW